MEMKVLTIEPATYRDIECIMYTFSYPRGKTIGILYPECSTEKYEDAIAIVFWNGKWEEIKLTEEEHKQYSIAIRNERITIAKSLRKAGIM